MDDPRPTSGPVPPRRPSGRLEEAKGPLVEPSAGTSASGLHEQPGLGHLPANCEGHELQPGLHAALEVCRPNTADLDDPALAEVQAALAADAGLRRRLASLQRFDQALAAALRDVRAPAGLEDRLLKAVSAMAHSEGVEPLVEVEAALLAPSSDAASASCVPPASVEADHAACREEAGYTSVRSGCLAPDTVVPSKRRAMRLSSRPILLAASLVLMVGAGLVIWQYRRPASLPTPQQLANEATGQFQQDLSEGDGMPASKKWPAQVPASFPQLRLPQGTKWRTCRLVNVSAVMFDVTQAGVKGALYVVRAREVARGAQVPNTPTRVVFTQGVSRTMWRQGDYLCVLIVEGDEQALRRLLRPVPPVT